MATLPSRQELLPENAATVSFDFVFNPPIPAQQIVGLGVLLGAVALFAYWRGGALSGVRRVALTVLRLAAVAGITVLLLRPMRDDPAPEHTAKPPFVVLVDSSGSMNTPDVAGRPRFRVAVDRLEEGRAAFLSRLAREKDMRFYEFSDTTRATDPAALAARAAADGPRTHLGQALAAVLATSERGGEHGGVLLVSDGRDNSGENLAETARLLRTRQVPVWAVCVGTPEDARDLYVTGRLTQNFMFAGQPASLRVTLSHSGYEHRDVAVQLHREDRYVATRQVALRRGATQIEFPLREERKGLFKYRVSVAPLPGEADTRNNSRTVFARVVEEKTRALLVEAQPHWDSKFLLRALQGDPNLEITSIFQLSPTKTFAIRDRTSAQTLERERETLPLHMPRTKDELYRYDCLVLGRGMDQLLTAEEMGLLRDYLTERGGSIVFFRGRFYEGDSVAGRLEPVTWADDLLREAQLELTPDGRISPVFAFSDAAPPDTIVRSMPPLASVTRVKEEKALAVVLAVANGAVVAATNLPASGPAGAALLPAGARPVAAIAYQRFGKGKVMSIGASGLWRWAFLPAATTEGDEVYQRLWRQIVQWMVFESDFLPGQDIAFRTAGYTYQPGVRVNFTIATKNVDLKAYHPRIEVVPPSGTPFTLQPLPREDPPTDFLAGFTPEEEGEYTATLHNNVGTPRTDVARFTVYSDLVENRLVASDAEALARLCAETGGELLGLDQLDDLPAKARAFSLQAREKSQPRDVWPRLPVFAAMVAALSVEWFLRKRWGLV